MNNYKFSCRIVSSNGIYLLLKCLLFNSSFLIFHWKSLCLKISTLHIPFKLRILLLEYQPTIYIRVGNIIFLPIFVFVCLFFSKTHVLITLYSPSDPRIFVLCFLLRFLYLTLNIVPKHSSIVSIAISFVCISNYLNYQCF